MRSKIYFLFSFCFFVINVFSQDCSDTSVGFPPINDLGTGFWRGNQGGLYLNGSNSRPFAHNQAGLNIANQILPLDTSGSVDLVNGKIVWISIGMSNTTQETQVFIPMANSLVNKNPQLVLIDGAQGGQDIDAINNPNANFWTVINNRLTIAGLTYKQVQVVWFKQAEGGPSDTSFLSYPDSLKNKFILALQLAKNKFPNASLGYLSSRIYAGYASTALNPEPFSYYSG